MTSFNQHAVRNTYLQWRRRLPDRKREFRWMAHHMTIGEWEVST